MDNISVNVIAIIKSMAITENVVESDNVHDLGIDSLKIVELIINLEDEFQIQFDDSELDPSQLITVKDIIDLTKRYIEK